MPATMSEITTAIEDAWTALREQHPNQPGKRGLPPVLILVTPQGLDDGGTTMVPEVPSSPIQVAIGNPQLTRGGLATFRTLVHHAAHVLAHVRGIADTDETGRYHNRRYLQLAEELGMVATSERDHNRGFANVDLRGDMIKLYGVHIGRLSDVLTGYQPQPARVSRVTTVSRRDQLKASCKCKPPRPPRSFRIAEAVLELGGIKCEICNERFTVS